MKRLLVVALAASSVCIMLGIGVGDGEEGVDLQGGLSVDGDVGLAGDGALGAKDGASCPAYPSTPVLWIDPSQETAYANGDPYTSVTDFGSDGTDLATTTNSASTPTFLDPCEDGVANNRPCASFDGGDFIRQAAANAALGFFFDGTGMTCAWVVENDGAAAGASFDNGAWSSSDKGVLVYFSGASGQHGMGITKASAPLLTSAYEPNSVTVTNGTVFSTVMQHAAGNSPQWATWRNGTAADSGSYSGTPATGAPTWPLTLSARAGVNDNRTTQQVYELVCFDDGSISVDAIHEVLTCKYGALPS